MTLPTASEAEIAPWAAWASSEAYTVGTEEEVMVLEPGPRWPLAQRVDEILSRLSEELAPQVAGETQDAVLELATRPHRSALDTAAEAAGLRSRLCTELASLGLHAAAAGTHPCAVWTETRIATGERQQRVYGSMRELARREPTFGLHVHVGVSDAEAAIRLHNRMRCHLPLLLALSANSPFWQGRDTGLASTRTPIFQAFPRVGLPRAFADYSHYVETVDRLLRAGAFPEPTFLWWDVRPQPRFGTVEVRIMDAQSEPWATRALTALVQAIAALELEEGYHVYPLSGTPELLAENRFLAARDGVQARLIDPVAENRVPVRTALGHLLERARPHAEALGAAAALGDVERLLDENGALAQRRSLPPGRPVASVLGPLVEAFST